MNQRGANGTSSFPLNTPTTIGDSGPTLVSRKLIPLKRASKSISYVVGLISFEEYKANQNQHVMDDIEIQEKPPKDIAPPYVLCMNFSQIKTQDKAPEILDLSQDSKPNDTFMPGTLLDR